jgi:hypothetical protein
MVVMLPTTVDPSAAEFVTEVVPQILLIGGAVVAAMGLAFAVTCWLVVRRIRRSGVVQRGVRKGSMVVRSVAADDAGRKLARLRMQLERSSEATVRSLAAADAQGRPLGDLPAVAANLARAERALDEQLHLAQREPNPQLRKTLVPGLSEQVERLSGLSAELRQSLLQNGHTVSTSQIERVSTHLALEVDALRTWNTAYGSRQLP